MENLSKTKKELTLNVLNLFSSHRIDALPMKLYSDDDDVDIVIIDKDKYEDACDILLLNNWYIKNNRSKLRERDKNFLKHKNIHYVIHLHKAFSWNTIVYLNSNILWKRRRIVSEILLPSVEDELLIIAAHSLFENQYIKSEEIIYGGELLENKYDLSYMRSHADQFHWQKGLDIVMKKLKKNESSLSMLELLSVKINKLKQDFKSKYYRQIISEGFNYFVVDWVWNYRILLQKKLTRRPIIITLSGVDGSGKTTAALFLKQELKKLGKQFKIIHTGTTPLLKQSRREGNYRLSIIGYMSLIKDLMYIFLSLLYNINYEIIIFDRYTYDTLVKISYKKKQKTINKHLITLSNLVLPKPKLSFLFEAPPKLSYERDRNHSLEYHKEKHSLYHNLFSHIPSLIQIETAGDKKKVESIIATWLKFLLKNKEDIFSTTPICKK